MTRAPFDWKVTLHARDGSTAEEHVSAYWDPEHEGTREAVGVAGMVQAWVRSGKPTEKASDLCVPAGVSIVAT